MPTVDEFRRTLDADLLELVDGLREIVAGSHPDLTEHIKWNAPSFAIAGDDRLTLGLQRNGGVRLVLHRGAKPKDSTQFRFADVDRLAKWLSPDRGVIVFKSVEEVDAIREPLLRLCARWISQTA